MKIKEILQHLEFLAPPEFQEDYDNSGMIAGDAEADMYRGFTEPGLYGGDHTGSFRK